MNDLAETLSEIFKAGLDANPDMRECLVQAMSDHLGQPEGQYTKAEANYRVADTPGEECQACVHYDENASSCEVVAGRISPHYVSDWFEAKDAAKAQPAQQDQPE